MKKVFMGIVLFAVFLSLCACSQPEKNPPAGTDKSLASEMSCEEIIKYVYEHSEKTEFMTQLEQNENPLVNTVISGDGKSYFGTAVDFSNAIASEPDSQPPAYSFCIAKLNDGADINKTVQSIIDNADANKWVCESVSTVYVESRGNTVALIMADKDTADALKEAFLSLSES